MNVRKSTASLTAGICSLGITASLVVAAPGNVAATELPAIPHRTVSVLDQPYELTASAQAIIEDLLVVAGLPFYNVYTTLNTLGGVTVFVTNTNKALGALYTGQWSTVPGLLESAWKDEQAALTKIAALPQTLVDYNVTAINNLLANFQSTPQPASVSTFSSAVAAVPAAAAAAPADILSDAVVVAGLPFYNVYTTLNTLGGVTVFVANTNKALGALYTGQWSTVPGLLESAWKDEQAALTKIAALPQTLVDYNVTAINNLLANFQTTPESPASIPVQSASAFALPAAAASADEGTSSAVDEAADSTNTADTKKTAVAVSEPEDVPEVAPAAVEETDEATVTKDGSEAEVESESEPTEVSESEANDAGAAADEGADKPADEGPASGKHARDDDGDSADPASTGTPSSESAPGKHRKADADTGSSSASSTGGSDDSAS